jgi:hypothetical protein
MDKAAIQKIQNKETFAATFSFVVVAPFPILFPEAKVGPFDVVRLKESVGDDVGSLVGADIGDLVVGALDIGACVFIALCVGDFVMNGLELGAFESLFTGCVLGDSTALTSNTE